MLSNFAMGAGYSAFVSLLIPPFAKEATGDASAAGVVMAIIVGIAFVILALSAESTELYAIDAIVMGVGIAAVSAVGPVFIVGARLAAKTEANPPGAGRVSRRKRSNMASSRARNR
jgi:multidrug transporter EmrE-like cation transporter